MPILLNSANLERSRQFLVFILVGGVSALIDIGLMEFLILIGTNYLIATSLGFFFGLVVNFALHTSITFGSSYSHRALARFLSVVLLNYALTLLSVWLFNVTLNMPLLGKVLSMPLVAVNGYLLSKHWVYR